MGKTTFGGTNHGFISSSAYHDPAPVSVKNEPANPARFVRITHPMSSNGFLI